MLILLVFEKMGSTLTRIYVKDSSAAIFNTVSLWLIMGSYKYKGLASRLGSCGNFDFYLNHDIANKQRKDSESLDKDRW